MKSFNLGNVWGRVAGVQKKKTDNEQEYLRIQVECANELYGNVKAFGRLWGKEKIEAFIDHFKKHPGATYRFKGFFSQYDDREGRRLSNFTFFDWMPFEGTEFRASFVLSGTIMDTHQDEESEVTISIHLSREGKDGYKDTEEEFKVYAFTASEASGVKAGDFIQVKGLLRAREPEDYFGMPSGAIKAYAMEIRISNKDKATTEGPF